MELPQHWRLADQRYRLIGEKCPHCEASIFPPHDVCPECSKPAGSLYTFAGTGTVYSHTTIIDAPEGFDGQEPYVVAMIKLDEGPLVTAQLTDLDGPPEIGMPVEMVTRKLRTDGDAGIIVYGYKFRTALEHHQDEAASSQDTAGK
ncbi:MAG: Zn-ribbon domain-containing OB-fold protein [Anaerolineae bacterium]|nr:Zn-ribbon domain-containing OB-fold protein [Anaerolineae bacterium]